MDFRKWPGREQKLEKKCEFSSSACKFWREKLERINIIIFYSPSCSVSPEWFGWEEINEILLFARNTIVSSTSTLYSNASITFSATRVIRLPKVCLSFHVMWISKLIISILWTEGFKPRWLENETSWGPYINETSCGPQRSRQRFVQGYDKVFSRLLENRGNVGHVTHYFRGPMSWRPKKNIKKQTNLRIPNCSKQTTNKNGGHRFRPK